MKMTSRLRLARHRLDDGTRDLLAKTIAENVTAADLDPDNHEGILARIGSHALSRYLPGEILQTLQVFTGSGLHVLLLTNLPQQRMPSTPIHGFCREPELTLVNAIHLGLIQLIGVTPFAVRYENAGQLMRNVVPNPAARGTTSSWGADAEFFWHTDNPNLPFGEPGSDPRKFVPRYLTFYTVRNDERVATDITAVDDLVDRLDEETRHWLRSPSFAVGAPASNDAGPEGDRRVLAGVPVLELNVDGHRVRYDRGTTFGRSAAATSALGAWVGVLQEAPALEQVLSSGEFLIFDNYRVLHRRRAFTAGPDATARWLRRCYAS
jgi:hypothetical protein